MKSERTREDGKEGIGSCATPDGPKWTAQSGGELW